MAAQVKTRLAAPRPRSRSGTFSIGLTKVELIAGVVTVAVLIATVAYYVISLRPVHARVAEARARRSAQEKILTDLSPRQGSTESPKTQIKLAKASLDDFKDQWLKPMTGGRITVINQLNELVAADKVHLTSGIEMHIAKKGARSESSSAASDSSNSDDDAKSGSASRSKKSDVLDVYPKVQFRFSVVGRYEDVRKFLKDLQTTKEFLVIDSMVLADVEAKGSRGSRGANFGAGAVGIGLSATVTAYFRPG
ncbi:MAG TPA: hypothetical protein VLZ81_10140 [Blastocatellia bacterium]|nr:hypothetical protein [Blastocatellia bacterium]